MKWTNLSSTLNPGAVIFARRCSLVKICFSNIWKSWRDVHYSLWIDGFLNRTGVPGSNPLPDVQNNGINIEKKPAKDVFAALLSLKISSVSKRVRRLVSMMVFSRHFRRTLKKSISAFENDKKHFDTLERNADTIRFCTTRTRFRISKHGSVRFQSYQRIEMMWRQTVTCLTV